MKRVLTIIGLLSAIFIFGFSAWAQLGRGQSFPKIFGDWNGSVGSGAAYSIQTEGKDKLSMYEVAVVGEEQVDGQTGHWVEMRFDGGRDGQSVIMKYLFVKLPNDISIKRAIFKTSSQPAMEMPMNLMGNMGLNAIQKDTFQWKSKAKLVGTETVTTPAGSFSCEHYQTSDNGEVHDVWLSSKVSPYGLIKSKTPKTTLTLQKVLTGEKTKITETPKKFEIPMRGRQ